MNAPTHLLRARLLLVCLVAALVQNSETKRVIGSASASNNESTTAHNLVLGAPIRDAISVEESRLYAIKLSAGDHARIELERRDLQLAIRICSDKERPCVQMLAHRFGPLDLSFSAALSATYLIEIKSLEKDKRAQSYEIVVKDISRITPQLQLGDQARRAMAQAEQFLERQDEASQVTAALKYSEASRLWQSAGEFGKAAKSLCRSGDVYFTLSQYQQSLVQNQKALSLSERNGDEEGMMGALNGIAYAYAYLGANDQARTNSKELLDTIARLRPAESFKRLEAQALNTMGEVDYAEGELRRSLDMFERARSLYVETEDRDGQALALLNLGYSHSDLGEAQKASGYYQDALTLFQAISDHRGLTLAQTALGTFYSLIGEEDKALSLHKAASEYFRNMGNKQGLAAALNGIARAYQDLNDYDSALAYYNQALALYEQLRQGGNVGLSKFFVARVLFQKGQVEQATQFYNQSLVLSRAAGDRVTEAHALKGLGSVYLSRDDVSNAVDRYNAALQIYQALGNRRSEAYVLNDLAHIHTYAHNPTVALTYLEQALPLMRDTEDRHGEALTLFNTAKAELTRGNLAAALKSIEESIAIGESLRTKTSNSQLRTSYFASVNEQYELYVDVLMALNAQEPSNGYAAAALLASERGRARSLLDSLFSEKIQSQNTSSPDLLAEVQNVLQSLSEKAEYQTRLLAGKHTPEETEKISQELRDLTIKYHELRAKLRKQNPSQATLIDPAELTIKDLQQLVDGDDSLLLEFKLNHDRSYAWLVSSSATVSYELPSRAKIEALAHQVYESATKRQASDERLTPAEQEKAINEADGAFREQAAALSNMLFGPFASQLRSKHLMIVGDGLLHFVPFDALPLPDNTQKTREPRLLVSAFDITLLPSALTLVALRLRNPTATNNQTIGVIADPVFERDDPRVLLGQGKKTGSPADQDADTYLSSSLRDFDQNEKPSHISRLPATLGEAKVINELGPAGSVVTNTGFAANKQKFINESVRGYRVLHIATHGLVNAEHPELSGLVFSLLDEQGRNVDGFLRLHDVYNLDVPAALVVLSACRTGLGADVQGEGVVGLTSGFMYAGATTVVSSLWKVDDTATAEFMKYFYSALLKDRLSPAEALRTAKLEMQQQERWRAPFYWAGFVLQGEYTNRVLVQDSANRWPVLIIIVIFLVGGTLYAFCRYLWRKSRL